MSIQSFGTNAQAGHLVDGLSSVSTTLPTTSTISNGSPAAPSVPTASASNASPGTPSTTQVAKAVQDLNKSVQSSAPGLEFSLDTTNNQMVIRVVDQETNEVIMQIPNQEVIEMSQSLDQLQGLLVKLKA